MGLPSVSCGLDVAFCLLPGDTADDDIEPQYRLVRHALDKLAIPVHISPGDHDRKQGDLHAFYSVLGAAHLPYAASTDALKAGYIVCSPILNPEVKTPLATQGESIYSG